MGTIGGPHDRGVVVAEVFSGEEVWAVGEGKVVFGEAFDGGSGGGDEEDGAGAEAEEEDGTVARGEGTEGAVDGVFEEVEVADDREGNEARC